MVNQTNKIVQDAKQEIKSLEKDYIFSVGRRKSATVTVRLYKKDVVIEGVTVHKGEIVVNNISCSKYFGKGKELICFQPLDITKTKNEFAVSIKTSGGGKEGQRKKFTAPP